MKEGLVIPRAVVQEKLRRIEPGESYSKMVADRLNETCIGQEEAAEVVARRMVLADASMNDADRPLAVMMFAGRTGVGKTEMAHAASEEWFNDRDSEHLKIIDCTEYADKHVKLRLTGAPPSYVGYNDDPVITNEFLETRNIIVLDEFEKSHPEFQKLWLGVFEDARMSTGKGDKLNFANSMIIMTSNAGAEEMQAVGSGNQRIGFGGSGEDKGLSMDSVARRALKERFKEMPELLGRIDDIVVFKDLAPEHYSGIFDNFVKNKNLALYERMQEQAPFFSCTEEFKSFIIDGIDKAYGARDMRKALDREMFHRAADLFMGTDLTGRPLVADREGDTTVFYTDDLPGMDNVIDFEPYLEDRRQAVETSSGNGDQNPEAIDSGDNDGLERATIIIFTPEGPGVPALPDGITPEAPSESDLHPSEDLVPKEPHWPNKPDGDDEEPPIRQSKKRKRGRRPTPPRLPRPRNELDYTIFEQ